MRIVVVFLMLAAVSIFGVSLFLRTAQDSPFSLWTGLTTQAAPQAAEDPPQPAAQSQPAPPVTQPVSQPAANPVAPVQQVQPGETVTFTIKSGETTSSVAKRLAEAGLTRHELLFRFMVQWRGAEGRLQAGDYQLREGMTEDELIEALQSAKARDVAITFIEGRRIEEFAEMLEKADIGISGQRFLDLARRGNFTYDFLETKPAGATLEGFLFPDTYRVIP
ncbi:MAG TPA: endolytic transglycosylase MltG, partial [Chloroflexota bacterium]|nr:endolytic transglycosylase MltG [Chloroflexota bacterium]